ncbi:hypothetical protein G3I13_01920 [Streptomyces sp. SID6673]|nr:hypothetical protein [Streptomyces sp. SID11726]NDZ94919.1 hypothetical protein [Streptomyces sp. SID11726]NEB23078.1 hypothetical protein [Streptomyces sp. SID6673]
MTSQYNPNHIRSWFLEKNFNSTQRQQIASAKGAVVIRESEKACFVQWLSEAGEIVLESWVPKSALELKADSMVRIAGEEKLKTELREWMWQRGLPSDGTESIEELQNEAMWHGHWKTMPKHLQRAHKQKYSPMGRYS